MDKIDLLYDTQKQWSDFQINLLVAIIYKVEKQDNPFKTYKIKAKDVLPNKLSFDKLKLETATFLNRTYQVQTTSQLTQLSIFSSIAFIIGEGIIEVVLHPLFKTQFLRLKEEYTLVSLKNLLQFKSVFSKKLYLLLKKSQEQIVTISIDDLKQKLGLEAAYQDYHTFKKRVILQAQKELHETEIAFFFEEIKRGRKVASIRFIKIAIERIILNNEQIILQNKLVNEVKITPTQAKKIVVNFASQEIYATLYLIKEAKHKGHIKTSLAGYTVSFFNKMLLQKK